MINNLGIKRTSATGLVIAMTGLFFPSIAFGENEQVVMWECTAQANDVGREGAGLTAPVFKWPDGSNRTIEAEAQYYTSDNIKDHSVKWVEVFGAQNGHGSSLIGFVNKKLFECKQLPAE